MQSLRHLRPLALRTGVRLAFPTLVARRHLGNAVRGPKFTDIQGHVQCVKDFFTKPANSYYAFRRQAESVRLAAFVGVSAYVTLSLMLNPPKSSYWLRFAPWRLPSRLGETVWGESGNVFLDKPLPADSWGAYKKAVGK
uniref:Uncharacterized protein n=1 Tax=Chromera velia CCMP2878 TaxID=1169474 RepID=A0A0G4IFS7_9ALVE|mmetsp:Transcript_36656/g.72084  ORF Transcript_36656/g.72084 Transcript_36656/m.72084 type:complete len:139 (-) Transcript_36656:474-890(-)|eukprot:Cvel_13997.t1-p1 / transcript=Cvel_13997.t1 / gene=Cvel_13997 / organism=Chromera_velia_CCMP2878 / gene_product=hypothetical protein / transcript_product=hypothetical protein / location=Cvel_scaffold978:56877-57384(+) / protein_length=138 / sequence_SO=supercontig / SO=protein_coding / is_pseudo=false